METAPRLDPLDRQAPPAPPQKSLRRVPLWLAVVSLFVALVLAHLSGTWVGALARTLAPSAPGTLAPAVIVPSMLASELALLAVALIIPLALGLPVRESLGLHAPDPRLLPVAALGTVMLGPLGDQLMTLFSDRFPDLTFDVVPMLHDLARRLPLAWLLLTFALVPGVAEELLFRGMLQRSVRRRWPGIVLSGVAFALFHVDPVHIIGVLPLGLFLSWVASRSHTTVTIVAHVLNNALSLFAVRNAELDMGYGSEQALPIAWLWTSLALFALAVLLVLRMTRPPSAASA